MAVPGEFPQAFSAKTSLIDTDRFPFVHDLGSELTWQDSYIKKSDLKMAIGAVLPTIGTGGDYATYQLAVAAGFRDVAMVANVTELVNTTIAINLSGSIKCNGFTWAKAGIIVTQSGTSKFRVSGGKLTYSGAVVHFTQASTGTVDFIDMECTPTGASTLTAAGKTNVSRSIWNLANVTNTTFTGLGAGSIWNSVRVISGGTSTAGFVQTGDAAILSEVTFEGDFDTNIIMDFDTTAGAIFSNVRTLNSKPTISLDGAKHKLSNIDNFSIDLVASVNCELVNINCETLDMSDASGGLNRLTNVAVEQDLTVAGDDNRFTNFVSQGAVTVSGNNNTFASASIEVDAYTDSGALNKLNGSFRVNEQTGTTYTLDIVDEYVRITNGAAITVTLPQASTLDLPIGFQVTVSQGGAGQITFEIEGAETLVSADGLVKSRTQHCFVTAIKRSATEWELSGDMTA